MGGCIAGGRGTSDINANGGHGALCFYPLLRFPASMTRRCWRPLKSPLFMAYHDGQPFNENMFRPCPMLENPGKLQEMVEKSGARSTDMQSPEPVENLTKKCQPYAENWIPTAGRLWSCSPKCKGACSKRNSDAPVI